MREPGRLQRSLLGSLEQAFREAFQTEATNLHYFVLPAFKSHVLLLYLQVLEQYFKHEDMWQTLLWLIQSPQVGSNIFAIDLP